MKIAIAQLSLHIGHFDYNFSKIKEAVSDAKNNGADLILFPELTTCGYPPRDFLEFKDSVYFSSTAFSAFLLAK